MLDGRAKRMVWAFLVGVTAIEGYLTFLSIRGHGDIPAALLRFAFFHPAPLAAWAAAGLIAALYVGYSATASATIRRHMLTPWTWKPYAAIRIFAIVMALVTGFFEEAVFRRTLMDVLLHHGFSDVVQVVVSALAFGAAHAVWGLFGGNFRGSWNAMVATSMLGGALALLYLLDGRAIGPCIAAHIAINLLLEPWLIITAVTNGWSRASANAA